MSWKFVILLAVVLLTLLSIIYPLVRVIAKRPAKFTKQLSALAMGVSALVTLSLVIRYAFAELIPVTLSTEIFWPHIPPTMNYTTDGVAKVMSGGFEQAVVELSGVGLAPRLLFSLGYLLVGLALFWISWLSFKTSSEIMAGQQFKFQSSKRLTIGGSIVICAGTIGSLLISIASYLSQLWLFGWNRGYDYTPKDIIDNPWLSGSSTEAVKVFGMVSGRMDIQVEAWPLLVGLAVLVVAQILKRGASLEKDVEGLV